LTYIKIFSYYGGILNNELATENETSDESPSIRNSAPFMSNANPMTIKIILKNIIMLKPCSLKALFLFV